MDERSQPGVIARVLKPTALERRQHTPGGHLHVAHGDEHGLGDVSLMLSYNPPGGGPRPHFHDYIEVFVVTEGRGLYTVDGEDLYAEAGDIVVVPPGAVHSFVAIGDSALAHTSIQQSSHSVTKPAPGSR